MDFGKIVFKGKPQDGISELDGKVFEKHIKKIELEKYKKEFNVISNRLIGGNPVIHVLANKADKTFKKIEPTLEDVFFSKLSKNKI